jgi:hypothetical protein
MAIPFSARDAFEFSEAHRAFSTRRSPLLVSVVVTYRCEEYSLRCRGASVVACTLLQSVQPEANFFNFINSDIGALAPRLGYLFAPKQRCQIQRCFTIANRIRRARCTSDRPGCSSDDRSRAHSTMTLKASRLLQSSRPAAGLQTFCARMLGSLSPQDCLNEISTF